MNESFTKFAKYYDFLWEKGKDKYNKEGNTIHWIIQNYSDYKVKNVLDLMCGAGRHILVLSDKGYEKIVGVDISEEVVNLARERLRNRPNIKIFKQDARELNLPYKFDAVYCVESLEYLYSNIDLMKVLSNVNNLLNEKGLFICNLKNRDNYLDAIQNSILPFTFRRREIKDGVEIIYKTIDYSWDEDNKILTIWAEWLINEEKTSEEHRVRLFSEGEFRNFLKKSGFSIKKIFDSLILPIPLHRGRDTSMVFVAYKKEEPDKIVERVKKYLEDMEILLYKGKEELKLGNVRDASKKFWEAAYQAIKAFAEIEEENLSPDRDGVSFIIMRIAIKTKDLRIRSQFEKASDLHTNFYERHLTKDKVENYSLEVEKFCQTIKKLLKNWIE